LNTEIRWSSSTLTSCWLTQGPCFTQRTLFVDGRIYLLNWSRYIPASEGATIATRLASLNCGAVPGAR
jgi:hypothetical protein